MKPMPFFLETKKRRQWRGGVLANFTYAAQAVILACVRPTYRHDVGRSLLRHQLEPDLVAAVVAARLPLDANLAGDLVEATYEICRVRDWEERRIQSAIRRGVLPPSHDGFLIEERLRPVVVPSADQSWCSKDLGPHAALAYADPPLSMRDRADHPRRLRAEQAIKRGIVPTDTVEVRIGSTGFFGVCESHSAIDAKDVKRVHRVVQLDRRRWDEVLRLGLDQCENGLILAVRHLTAEEPWGRIFEVEAAQRGRPLNSVKEKIMHAVSAFGRDVQVFEDRRAARDALDAAQACYWTAQLGLPDDPISAEDATAFAELDGLTE